ncbi:MAG TPA: hypothetical protein VGO56_13255 [Pyrinomonadaceae bacterium]|jgi:hypothetical protein|nr:hypothetical protein [Pyrinomonadaceae bacterium]
MPKVTPRKIEDKIDRTLNAWQELAAAKTFGGMTFAQFQTAVAPAKEARERIEDLQDQLTQALNQRDAGDEAALAKMQLIVNGVLADPTEGPESSLYEAMGYTRKSERKSGLTRKKSSKGGTAGPQT